MNRLLKICSTVLRPGLKPVCSSASSSSALALSRLRITRGVILLGCLLKLTVRQFWHRLMLPFFAKGSTSDFISFLGHSLVSQIFWHRSCLATILKQLRWNVVHSWTLSYFYTMHSLFNLFSQHRQAINFTKGNSWFSQTHYPLYKRSEN